MMVFDLSQKPMQNFILKGDSDNKGDWSGLAINEDSTHKVLMSKLSNFLSVITVLT
jgi:hypothetical protein